MITTRQLFASFVLVILSCSFILAQDSVASQSSNMVVTATASAGRIRFVAPSTVNWIHVDIYDSAGKDVFNNEISGGNVLDWHLQDKQGELCPDASYTVVISVKSASGTLNQRRGTISIENKTASVQPLKDEAQQPPSLTVLREGERQTPTVIAHDGQDGQLTRGKGALSFRLGDFYSGTDREQMRLTEEGNLGIGTDRPEARLDVNGMIRARSGFQFSDGSVLNLAPKGGLSITSPEGRTTAVTASPNAVTGTANRLPRFDTDGTSLVDSAFYQDPNTGFIGWGTTTPPHPFSVRRNGGTIGVHSIGELFVDRDDRTRSASLTVGTAGVLKWIFGMPFQSDGFQVYDLTNNVSRFFVNPTNGNIGMGTNNPTSPLTVVGPSNSQYVAEFNSSAPSTAINLNNTTAGGRAWTIYSSGTGSGPYPGRFSIGNSIGNLSIDKGGNVGIGPGTINDPLTWPLVVSGSSPSFPAIVAEFKNSAPETAIIISNTDIGGISWGLFAGSPASGGSPRSFSIGDFLSNERRLLIDSTGRVGIGTTSPQAKLQVAGDVYVQSSGSGIILRATNGANCYRVTVNDAGVLSTALLPSCP